MAIRCPVCIQVNVRFMFRARELCSLGTYWFYRSKTFKIVFSGLAPMSIKNFIEFMSRCLLSLLSLL